MSSETITRWRCDHCDAVYDGFELPDDWHDEPRETRCPDCRNDDAGQIIRLLAQLTAAELEAHEWKSNWRSMRADRDRLQEELRRLKHEARPRRPRVAA